MKTKTKIRRLLSVLLALAMLAGMIAAVPMTAEAVETDPYHAIGYCGSSDEKKVEWYLFDDGSIVFFGDGDMKNFSEPDAGEPAGDWYISNPMESLTGSKISIEDGITSVGNYAFYLPTYYTFILQTYNLDLPNSLQTIGVSAFENQNKLQKIAIPKNVTAIGTNAFNGCTAVKHIDIYGDPTKMTWDASYFGAGVTCHILPEYKDYIPAIKDNLKTTMTFEANLHEDQGLVDDDTDRNIKGYFGTENSRIFSGAAPFIVIGTFSGDKKSVTHGNNGFVSCVKVGNEYYVQTSNQSGDINLATIGTGGLISSLSSTAHPTLKLWITRDYIGKNIVRMTYHLKNTGNQAIDNVMLGGTGDIKIGADDYAAIKPLKETVSDKETQVGFYMQSGKEYDKGTGDKYATLGFIGKNVDLPDNGGKSPDATFFYGKAAANATESATGSYRLRLMPQRVFKKNSNPASQETGELTGEDTGMSYYWDVGTIAKDEEKQYAVLFSVYGTDDTNKGTEMMEEKTKVYHTVTWKNYDGSVLVKQLVEENETLSYPLENPTYSDDLKYYTFTGWSAPVKDEKGDMTCTAQYSIVDKEFFTGHSLTLQGDIGVYFYFDPKVANNKTENEQLKYSDVAIADDNVGADKTNKITIIFTWFDKESEYVIKSTDYDSDKKLFKARCNVAAAEMAYDIHATAYINGKKYVEEDNHYSVMEYGNVIINNPPTEISNESNYNQLKYLAQTMLDYGAKAQILFDRTHNVNGTSIPYANAAVSKSGYTMEAYSLSEQVPDLDTGLDEYGLKYYASSVVFLSKTTLRLYYEVIDQEKFDSYKSQYKTQFENQFTQNGTLYYLQHENIAAADLDEKYTFTIGTNTYEYSALDFAQRMQQNENSTQADKDLGTALYWYNLAANAYYATVVQG